MRVRQIFTCGLSGSTIFFHIFSWIARFSKNGIEYKMCVVIFFTTSVWNVFHSKKNWARYYHKCTHVCIYIPVYIYDNGQILTKLEFAGRIFEKNSAIKFHENLSSRSQVVPCRRTDMSKLNSRFSRCCERPWKRSSDFMQSILSSKVALLCAAVWPCTSTLYNNIKNTEHIKQHCISIIYTPTP